MRNKSSLRFLFALVALASSFTAGIVHAEDIIAPGKTGALELENDRTSSKAKLYVPSNYNPVKKWPLIINMHGMNGHADAKSWRGFFNGKDFFVAGMNYSNIEMEKDGKFPGRYPATPKNNAQVRKYIAEAIEKICTQYNIDRDTIIYAGCSMGGWNVAPFCFTKDSGDIYRGYIMWGCRPMKMSGTDRKYAKGKPFMIYHGEKCFVLNESIERMDNDISGLAKEGADITRKVYKGQGHTVNSKECGDDVRRWFNEIMLENKLNNGFSDILWQTGTLQGKLEDKADTALDAYIKEQDFYKKRTKEQPMLIWLYSTRSKLTKKGAKPATEVNKCEKAYSKLFDYPDCVTVPLASRYFTCVSIQMNEFSKKENPVLNVSSCPMIILVSADGETVTPIERSLTDGSVGRSLKALLTDEQNKELQAKISAFSKIKREWRKCAKDIKKDKRKVFKAFQKFPHNDKNVLSSKESVTEDFNEFQKMIGQIHTTE